MTQSGQGEEPSAQPAREGIVLPSDGGEPLLPGAAGTPGPAAPAGGQAWGGSWGPGQQDPQPGEGWSPAGAPQWDASGAHPPAATGPGPLPPEGAPAGPYDGRTPSYGAGGQEPRYGGQAPAHGGGDGQAQYGGGQQPGYGAPDPYQQQYQQPQQQYQAPPAPLPPAAPGAYPAAGPLPPTADGATQYIPPVPAADGATQYLPPVQAAAADGATQYIPPVQAAAADGATQYIPPVTPGALPPESAGEETRYLGRAQQQAAPAHSDADATQFIPPYTGQAQGGDRQPPAEFENLFRGGPAHGDAPAGSTQQLPRVQQPDAYPGPAQSSYGPPRGSYGAMHDDDGDDGRRSGRSRVPLIAAVGLGIVLVGVGAGALLSSGGGKDQGTDDKPVAAASPATRGSASPTADPARQQAVALDKLLADSGSSRASVIKAVGDVRQCANLDQSATNLRDAARQRNALVTRLGKLSVDKLPANGELTAALTRAWQASAAADNHYAAWAGQVKGGHKGCHKGHARTTGETAAGNRESGTASAQKTKAAALWNAIAQKYGLTQRQPTQL